MRAERRARVSDLIHAGAYAELRARLAAADRGELARSWPRLEPLHKLVAFKLLAAAGALDFYRRLPYREKYFLLCGFPLGSIAPVLENAPPGARRLFVRLPVRFYERMFRELARGAGRKMANVEN